MQKNQSNAPAGGIDFAQGRISTCILRQAVPMCIAQLVQLTYNMVDRMYIGRLSDVGSMALTGIGLCFPLTTLFAAFTLLWGSGGSSLFAIARGAGERERAEKILNQVLSMLLLSSILLFIFSYLFRRPVLYAFGASDESYVYADMYLQIYLFGVLFNIVSHGLNGFINAQGYPRIGMGTTLVGAALNLILDPVFIYGLKLGVRGAALATVISQCVSFLWVLSFFFGEKSEYRFHRRSMRPEASYITEIAALGLAGFIVQGTNCAVQIACNKTLQIYGGDLYVGIMTVLNSVREILSLPASGITEGAKPVLGFNYGAKKYRRIRKAIQFNTVTGLLYLALAWLLVILKPEWFMSIFTNDKEMILAGKQALETYFFGFVFMGFQFAGQSTFTALKCPKRAIFFSLFRKIIIVVPLTLLLPAMGYGVMGVFMAEPISNLVGGLASFTTMYLTLYRRLPQEDEV